MERNLLVVEPKRLAISDLLPRSDMGSKEEGDYQVSAGEIR